MILLTTDLEKIMNSTINLIVILLMVASYITQVESSLRGGMNGRLSTWIVWTILDIFLCKAMHERGELNANVVTATIGAIVLAVCTAYGGSTFAWKKIDTYCTIFGCLGALLLLLAKNPQAGKIFFLSGIIVGSIPTIIDAWRNPEKQKGILSWWMRVIASVITLANVGGLQPLTFTAIHGTIGTLLLLRRRKTQ